MSVTATAAAASAAAAGASKAKEPLPSLPLQLFSAAATDVAAEYEPRHRTFVRAVCEEQRLRLAQQYVEDAVSSAIDRGQKLAETVTTILRFVCHVCPSVRLYVCLSVCLASLPASLLVRWRCYYCSCSDLLPSRNNGTEN